MAYRTGFTPKKAALLDSFPRRLVPLLRLEFNPRDLSGGGEGAK
jgi:hypothetical protein